MFRSIEGFCPRASRPWILGKLCPYQIGLVERTQVQTVAIPTYVARDLANSNIVDSAALTPTPYIHHSLSYPSLLCVRKTTYNT